MPRERRHILTSEGAKRTYFILALFLILFIICNDFIMPWYVNRGGILVVPDVVGLSYDDAARHLDSLGLEARKGDTRTDREHPAGTVIIQNPLAGSEVKLGRRVYLTVSGGEQFVSVPNLKGRSLRDARFGLEREGLRLGTVDTQASDEFPAGTVISQSIGAGSRVKRDVYVSLIVSQGKTDAMVTVPEVIGMTIGEAEKILTSAGLRVGNITYLPSSDLLPNTIIDQFPRIGELVSYGQAIDLFVVQGGEKRKEVPEN